MVSGFEKERKKERKRRKERKAKPGRRGEIKIPLVVE